MYCIVITSHSWQDRTFSPSQTSPVEFHLPHRWKWIWVPRGGAQWFLHARCVFSPVSASPFTDRDPLTSRKIWFLESFKSNLLSHHGVWRECVLFRMQTLTRIILLPPYVNSKTSTKLQDSISVFIWMVGLGAIITLLCSFRCLANFL